MTTDHECVSTWDWTAMTVQIRSYYQLPSTLSAYATATMSRSADNASNQKPYNPYKPTQNKGSCLGLWFAWGCRGWKHCLQTEWTAMTVQFQISGHNVNCRWLCCLHMQQQQCGELPHLHESLEQSGRMRSEGAWMECPEFISVCGYHPVVQHSCYVGE